MAPICERKKRDSKLTIISSSFPIHGESSWGTELEAGVHNHLRFLASYLAVGVRVLTVFFDRILAGFSLIYDGRSLWLMRAGEFLEINIRIDKCQKISRNNRYVFLISFLFIYFFKFFFFPFFFITAWKVIATRNKEKIIYIWSNYQYYWPSG